jgi:sugar phosphate isomerase/epimerase
VQFNMSCAGLPTMPEEIFVELADRIRGEMDRRNLLMVAVSGTFNMIHPARGKQREGLQRLGILASACGRRYVSDHAVYRHTRARRYVALPSG